MTNPEKTSLQKASEAMVMEILGDGDILVGDVAAAVRWRAADIVAFFEGMRIASVHSERERLKTMVWAWRDRLGGFEAQQLMAEFDAPHMMHCPICHRPVLAMTQESPVPRPPGAPPWPPSRITIYTHKHGQCRDEQPLAALDALGKERA